MGINIHRGRIVCDKRWPDGGRFTRVCANRTEAKGLLARIEASIVDGTWPELKEKLKLRDREVVTLEEYSETYVEEYAKARNKPKAWKRKETSFKAINRHMGTVRLEAISAALLHRFVTMGAFGAFLIVHGHTSSVIGFFTLLFYHKSKKRAKILTVPRDPGLRSPLYL